MLARRAMTNQTFNLISVLILLVVSGCSSNAPVDSDQQSAVVTTTQSETEPTVQDAPLMPHSVLNDSVETVELQRLRIGPNKVECQGFHLTQCFLNTPDDQSHAEFFYDTIEGFDYQWGYQYELLVSVSSQSSLMSDTANQRFELIEIISQSEYQHQQSFDYVARYASESIVKIESGEFQLAGNQLLVCEPASCESLESTLAQGQSVVLNVLYGEQPGDPLQLAAVTCTESRGAFNNACMGDE